MQNFEAIMRKIQVLLEIARRDTTTLIEAENALHKVKELCSLYGIEIQNISDKSSVKRTVALKKYNYVWEPVLWQSAAMMSNVKVLKITGSATELYIIGRDEFLSVAESLFVYLKHSLKKHEKETKATWLSMYRLETAEDKKSLDNVLRSFRRSYATTIFSRLCNLEKPKVSNPDNLPVVMSFEEEERKLNEEYFVQSQGGTITIRKSKMEFNNSLGVTLGYNAAYKTNLNTQLENTTNIKIE